MPRKDGTGPHGMGSMTGRGIGWCNPRFQGGFGFRKGYYPNAQPYREGDEKDFLKKEISSMEEELTHMKKQLDNLNKSE